ncbi:hypothetical protein GGP45_003107 [Salinibacter ruber]|uniref:Uncharacterized protein n=1 Tax=Salinibacter ruber TaxID=146919 RepID=A0A9X2ZU02_9BACT|nr:hypothetical protein [Salinibacter ruber]
MRVTVHIGLHKCATTFFQRQVFSNYKGVNTALDGPIYELFDADGPLLISSELIGGVPWTRKNRGRPFQPTSWLKMFRDRIGRVQNLFSESRIIIGVRPQVSWIRSLYSQFLKEGGTLSFDSFFSLEQDSFLSPEDLLLSPRIQFLRESFENVLLYTLEDLKNIDHLCEALLQFVGGQEMGPIRNRVQNPSLETHLQVKTAQLLNSIDQWLTEHSMPTLRNSVFQSFNLNPRSIASVRMAGIPSKSFSLRENKHKQINKYYKSDWDGVLDYKDILGAI